MEQVKRSSKISGPGGGIGGAIISQPLDAMRGAERVEPALDAVKHHVTDHLARNAAAMGRDPGDDFAVMGVDRKGDAELIPFACIRRATVQRATLKPSRPNWRQSFCAP
jgi:hypothetical protein